MNVLEFPRLTILIVTYDRPREIRLTIESLLENVRYDGDITWHIADDGTGNNYILNIVNDFGDLEIKHSITSRKGWGANVNKALSSIATDYIYLNEDDYVAEREIDLSSGVALLEANKELGIIRYDGIAGHILNLELREQDTRVGRLSYLKISKHSPHLNVYSHRPHLKHRRLHDILGQYKEGITLGATEEEFAHRIKDEPYTDGSPHVAILPSGIPRAFDHIGHSRQGTDWDKLVK